jgi:hypothetical protein
MVEPAQLVAEMRSKLAPKGLIFLTIPNGFGLREIGGRLEKVLQCWAFDRLLKSL